MSIGESMRDDEHSLALLAHSVRQLADGQAAIREEMRDLTNAVTRLAIFEERQARQSEALDRAFKAIEKVEDRATVLELHAPEARRIHAWVDRAIAASLGLLGYYIAHKLGIPIP